MCNVYTALRFRGVRVPAAAWGKLHTNTRRNAPATQHRGRGAVASSREDAERGLLAHGSLCKIKSRAQFLRKGALSRVGRLEEMLRSMSSSMYAPDRSQLAALVLGRALALAVVAKTLRLPRQAGEGRCGQRPTPKRRGAVRCFYLLSRDLGKSA